MAEFEVNCITQTQPSNRHQDITHLGHRAHRWRLPISTVIYRILTKGERYYLMDQCTGQFFDIGVVYEHGKTYLRAHDNGQWNNRLLELKGCPWPNPSDQKGSKQAKAATADMGEAELNDLIDKAVQWAREH